MKRFSALLAILLLLSLAVVPAGRGATADENIPRCSDRSPDRARCGQGSSVADRPQQTERAIFRTVVHAAVGASARPPCVTAHEKQAGWIRGFSRFGDQRQKPADPEGGFAQPRDQSGGRPVFGTDTAEAIQRAIAWLHAQQAADGSFGFRRPDGSAIPSASITADAVYVLALLGENPAGAAWTPAGRSALDALATLAPTYVYNDAGQAGKVARAVARAGGDPRAFGGLDLVGVIQAAYDGATGRYHPALLYRHTLAVEGLLAAGAPPPQAALDALLQAQLPDGGWFWSFDGDESDVDSTGRVLQLLAGLLGWQCAPGYGRAASYLAAAQTATGGWGVYPPEPPNPNPANANSTALAVAGLVAVGYDPAAPRFQKNGRGALDSLLAFQEASGAFVYIRQPGLEENRLMATIDALNALAQPMTAPSACRPLYLPLLIARQSS